jgi:tyrosinase
MPYWTEPQDVATFPNNSIFDPETGFGGNGTATTQCVSDGPFANLTIRVNIDLSISPHCLTRNFNPCRFNYAVQANVDACQAKPTFELWRTCMETIPHAAGHGGIGATMENVALSPGDPMFFLHHTYLDKLWHEWQSADPANRTYWIGGTNQFLTAPNLQGGLNGELVYVDNGTMNVFMPPQANETQVIDSYCGNYQPNHAFPSLPAFVDYYGDGGGNVATLNHTLSSLELYPNATAYEVMDLAGAFVCAEYV